MTAARPNRSGMSVKTYRLTTQLLPLLLLLLPLPLLVMAMNVNDYERAYLTSVMSRRADIVYMVDGCLQGHETKRAPQEVYLSYLMRAFVSDIEEKTKSFTNTRYRFAVARMTTIDGERTDVYLRLNQSRIVDDFTNATRALKIEPCTQELIKNIHVSIAHARKQLFDVYNEIPGMAKVMVVLVQLKPKVTSGNNLEEMVDWQKRADVEAMRILSHGAGMAVLISKYGDFAPSERVFVFAAFQSERWAFQTVGVTDQSIFTAQVVANLTHFYQRNVRQSLLACNPSEATPGECYRNATGPCVQDLELMGDGKQENSVFCSHRLTLVCEEVICDEKCRKLTVVAKPCDACHGRPGVVRYRFAPDVTNDRKQLAEYCLLPRSCENNNRPCGQRSGWYYGVVAAAVVLPLGVLGFALSFMQYNERRLRPRAADPRGLGSVLFGDSLINKTISLRQISKSGRQLSRKL